MGKTVTVCFLEVKSGTSNILGSMVHHILENVTRQVIALEKMGIQFLRPPNCVRASPSNSLAQQADWDHHVVHFSNAVRVCQMCNQRQSNAGLVFLLRHCVPTGQVQINSQWRAKVDS